MIEDIYHVDIDCMNLSLLELYDIVNLAEMYDMPKLMNELIIQMENITLTMDSLMDVALLWTSRLLEEEMLLWNC